MQGFIAYASKPSQIGVEIGTAVEQLKLKGLTGIETWEENDIAGRFLVQPILDKIAASEVLVADISTLNFNVAFEIGFAIGKSKRVLLVKNSLIKFDSAVFSKLGIFDTLGYESYKNGIELANIIAKVEDVRPIPIGRRHSGGRPWVFFIEPEGKDTYDISAKSALKKSKVGFEIYDPDERGRLPGSYAIKSVVETDALFARFLSSDRKDAQIHNIRLSFCAGIAYALDRKCLLLQDAEEPIPLDYRDLVKWVPDPTTISAAVGELALELWDFHQSKKTTNRKSNLATLISKVDFGRSIAENEGRKLKDYYLETADFKRALDGDFQVICGRKGAGKTAFFLELRNQLRDDRKKLVLDLQPEGFQLKKFKESALKLLGDGSKDHLLQALWEYVILLEIVFRILRDDKGNKTHDNDEIEAYYKIAKYVQQRNDVESVFGGGDFAQRLERILTGVSKSLDSVVKAGVENQQLNHESITEVLHSGEIKNLLQLVKSYVGFKSEVWVLIDNLDKGWPPTGVTDDDVRIIRCLQEALYKVNRSLRDKTSFNGIVFIRSDVYVNLVKSTSDRGKVLSASLDLSSREVLKQILFQRIKHSLTINGTLEEIWPRLFVPNVDSTAEHSLDLLIDRSLMRPRCLIDLVRACQSMAITLEHAHVTQEDLKDGLESYSVELSTNIGLEVIDVFPDAPEIIYALVGKGKSVTREELSKILGEHNLNGDVALDFIELIKWFAVIGPEDSLGKPHFIYDHRYEMRLLNAVIAALPKPSNPTFQINPAFWAALEVDSF